MNITEHSAAAAVRMLLIKALFERFIDKCDPHKATYVVLVLPKHKASLVVYLDLIVVDSR